MFGERVGYLRKSFSLSQVELAQILGVSKQCVSNWENGYIQPSIDMLIKIAKYFKVSTDYLLDLASENSIPTNGLTDKEIAHIKLIIDDILKNK